MHRATTAVRDGRPQPGTLACDRPRVPTLPDADDVVHPVLSRDTDAFEAFYDAHYRLVFGIGLRLLGDAASAEDLTQAVFLKLWAKPASFTFREGSIVAWMGRVARNAGLDVLRSRASRGETEIPAGAPVEGAVEDTVLADLEAHRVRSALQRLPAPERIPIEMGFFGGMTYRCVAAETGVPLGTVKTRIRAGLHRLRKALQADMAL